MARKYRKFDEDFKSGAVQLVVETGKPIAQVARDLGINEGTLGNWCARSAGRGRRTAHWVRTSGPSLSGCVAR
jgi:transposase